ncbi:hypothetical protein E2C01_011463 [Portunus trituberculatus]|uniref:Uncharacterized protein n=1 Tax=Portunus trituberculatus TaxID=210409 RepID=A0A5B7DBT0_PORTR|nr:hypothetical protein [Portunus trituberculatus]
MYGEKALPPMHWEPQRPQNQSNHPRMKK